jgi:hypothetical protein
MPYHMDEHPEEFQTFVSTYDIDGFFNSLLEVRNIGGWILSAELPEKYPALTTSTLNVLLIGITAKYGDDVPVNIHWKLYDLSDWACF